MNKSLFLLSPLLATSLMAANNTAQNPCQCLEQGLGLDSAPKCYTAAYNAPAAISVKNSWNFNAFASFIYWHVSQESMETAIINHSLTPSGSNASQATPLPDFNYKPGFKVGFGFDTNYDDWTGWVEYTWLHQSITSTNTTSNETPYSTSPWLSLGSETTGIHSKWKMHLDMLDAAFSRPYYEGTQISISPYAGMRALWIRQNFNLFVQNPPSDPNQPTLSKNQSHSWAIGPMLGTIGHWMLGMGFRFEGKASGSLLYTQYTHLRSYQAATQTGGVYNSSMRSFHNYNVLRPTAELGVGLGWGSYFDNQNYYWDLSARYDFNIFWDQNVMARFQNALVNLVTGATGNLYLHGLTLSSRFDF